MNNTWIERTNKYGDYYFTYRKRLWRAIDDCDEQKQFELKECNPKLYNLVMEELNSIRNINWFNCVR